MAEHHAQQRDFKRRGGWLPGQEDLEDWLAATSQRVSERADDVELHPVIAEFKELIATDAILRMYMTRMIEEVPRSKNYEKRHLTSVDQLLLLINEVLTVAPEFSEGGMVTTPLAGILDWTMATPSGAAAYRDPRVNAILKKILDAWDDFLSSPASLYVLNSTPTGWKSLEAQRAVGMEEFQYDPDDAYWGFTSWNDFFTRHFTEEARPVASPNDDSVIVSACESTPYRIARDVQRQSEFWVKSQPYSLVDMLANDEAVDEFVGGTVYQSFLSALSYHRWHSPVSGTILRAYVQPGTYFSEADSEGENAAEPSLSQAYLAHVAARAIIIIEADNPAIGVMAFVPIGMVEVSSCLINPEIVAGHHVQKGDELGCFQFGGSTECLVFRPGVIEEFVLGAIPEPDNPQPAKVLVRSKLATAVSAGRRGKR